MMLFKMVNGFDFGYDMAFSMLVMQQLQFAKQPSKTKLYIMLLRLEKQQALHVGFLKSMTTLIVILKKILFAPFVLFAIFQRETISVMLKLTLTTTLNRASCTIC